MLNSSLKSRTGSENADQFQNIWNFSRQFGAVLEYLEQFQKTWKRSKKCMEWNSVPENVKQFQKMGTVPENGNSSKQFSTVSQNWILKMFKIFLVQIPLVYRCLKFYVMSYFERVFFHLPFA